MSEYQLKDDHYITSSFARGVKSAPSSGVKSLLRNVTDNVPGRFDKHGQSPLGTLHTEFLKYNSTQARMSL